MADINFDASDFLNRNTLDTIISGNVDIDLLKSKSKDLRSNINDIIKNGTPWPQSSVTKGFLPPQLINPNRDINQSLLNDPNIPIANATSTKKYNEYEYVDWMGQRITKNGLIPLNTNDRFDESKNLPKSPSELKDSPYSTRDYYLIFGDSSTDYFRNGLQVIDGLTPIENPENGESNLRLGQFKNTPFENNDPVMFGFEIVLDGVSSPLLNGSISDFLRDYSAISEVRSKIPVYEDFKNQICKFFKTTGIISSDSDQEMISKFNANYASADSPKSIYQKGRRAYLSYYLKKVAGLQNLIESNTTETKKYLVDYRKDVITLDFTEDVSLSMGTLSHLYKLLYWSKPNGKNIVPENLLRFNCDIIVSECRNFNRVRKAIDDGNIEVIKDNLSRHIYSLKECQFFFNNIAHNADIDMSSIQTYDNYSVSFDYKYCTTKFEKFVPASNGFGAYAGYDNGAIWKVGNPGERQNRGTQSTILDTSVPKFYTFGNNTKRENGVETPFVLQKFGINIPTSFQQDDINLLKKANLNSSNDASEFSRIEKENSLKNQLGNIYKESIDKERDKNFIERLKEKTLRSAKRELSLLVNGRLNLFSRTINKLMIGVVGGKGVSPPQNVYIGPQDPMGMALSNFGNRFFYDIRDELTDFAGETLSNFLNGATFKR